MASLGWLKPPTKVLELGPPERVFHSRQMTTGTKAAIWAFILVMLLVSGSLVFIRFNSKLIPRAYLPTADVVSAVVFGCGLLVLFKMIVLSLRRPNYLYAFYPEGLVIYQKGKWGYLPWQQILVFEQQSRQPYLFLENRQQIDIKHDFRNGTALCAELARHVYRKDPHTIEVSRDQVFSFKDELGAWTQLIAGVGMIFGALILTLLYWDGILTSFQPVKSVSHRELAMLGNPMQSQRNWVSLAAPKVIPTRVAIMTNDSAALQSKLVLIPIEDRFLVANVKTDFQGNALLQGEVGNWKNNSQPSAAKKKEALDKVMAEFPKLKERFLGYQFDAIVYEDRLDQTLAYVLGAIVLLGTTLLVRALWFWQRLRPSRAIR